jgi:hypothetical protein
MMKVVWLHVDAQRRNYYHRTGIEVFVIHDHSNKTVSTRGNSADLIYENKSGKNAFTQGNKMQKSASA